MRKRKLPRKAVEYVHNVRALPTPERMERGIFQQRGKTFHDLKEGRASWYFDWLCDQGYFEQEHAQVLQWYGIVREASAIRGSKLAQMRHGEVREQHGADGEPTNADHFIRIIRHMNDLPASTRRLYSAVFIALGCDMEHPDRLPVCIRHRARQACSRASALEDAKRACEYLIHCRKNILDEE